jgi:DMSO reductase anchor subunit
VSFFNWGELEPPIATFERRYLRPLIVTTVLLGIAVVVVCTHVASHERASRALRVGRRKKMQ